MSGKLRAQLLALWQSEATSSDEPDNAQLMRWVHNVVGSEKVHSRDLKAAERRIEELKQTLRLPHPTTTVVGAVVEHLNAAIAVLTGQVEPAAKPALVAPVNVAPHTWEQLTEVDNLMLPLMVQVKPPTGFVTLWRRNPNSRDFERNGRTMCLEQLRYLGKVTEVLS